ncbi:MAG: recombinase family protein [Butyrivibrio sp.]|nr:recombinase family protein [Butyrivibrio sp.]
MAKYGYVRVSTKEQRTDRQMEAMLEYGVDEKHIYADKLSGKDFNRPSYQKLMKKLKTGDLLVIKSIDRLGRDYREILEEWRKIVRTKEVDIEVIDLPLLNTTQEIDGIAGVLIADILLRLLAYVSQTERDFIRQRQAEGIAIAIARGIHFGRERIEPSDDFDTWFDKWISGEVSSRVAAERAGMKHTTFYRRCKEKLSERIQKSCSKK